MRLGIGIWLSWTACSAALALAADWTPGTGMAADHARFFATYCQDCHGGGADEGGLDLDALSHDLTDRATFARWERIYDRVQSGEMPPKGNKIPTSADKNDLLVPLGEQLVASHVTRKGTAFRRLNRHEFEYTLRDLLGVDVNVKHLLPEDATAHGLDNIGEVQGMSDVQLMQYMEAAGEALDTVLSKTERPVPKKQVYHVADPKVSTINSEQTSAIVVLDDGTQVIFNSKVQKPSPKQFVAGKNGEVRGNDFRASEDGEYRVRIQGYAYQSDSPVLFVIRAGNFGGLGSTGEIVAVGELGKQKSVWEQTLHLSKNDRLQILPELSFDYSKSKQPAREYPLAGLAISEIEVDGPQVESWPPRGQTLLVGDLPTKVEKGPRNSQALVIASRAPEKDAAERLHAFANAAFRRPVSTSEIQPYLDLFGQVTQNGGNFTSSLKTVAVAMLTSPDFLYLPEPPGKLDDYAVASRLSYTFWRSMPDEALLKLASSGKLHDADVLRQQVDRMLADPKAVRFYNDFTDGWLRLRDIDFTAPDSKLYPEYDDSLRYSMLEETRAFFREMVENNLPTSNIADSDFAMLNRRLAVHYELPAVQGMEIRKVKLPAGSVRGGILSQASVLKVSANGTNTSPVVRGAYFLDCILGSPPPPPPPGIPGVEPDIRGATTLRQILDKHRNDENCNSCHNIIDPPGFALENFDVIGGYREQFRTSDRKGKEIKLVVNHRGVSYRVGLPVDAGGKLRSGKAFKDFKDFKKLLSSETPRITLGLTTRLLMFATGRELGFSDRPETYTLVSEHLAEKQGVRDLIYAIVQNEIFLNK